MSRKAARTAMPKVAAWIDELREAFGHDVIDAQIRSATVEGLPTFFAREAGRQVGTPLPALGRHVTAADMVILPPTKGTP